MLAEIRACLKERDAASLDEIAAHLHANREVVELALRYWIARGKVRITTPACGQSCTSCHVPQARYAWQEAEGEATDIAQATPRTMKEQ